jgi:Protein of unknown function (DUF3540)
MGEMMNSTARKVIPIHSNRTSDIHTGYVISTMLGEISINIAGEIKKGKKAFSCIIDPEPDDIVICTENEDGILYVLSIIERPNRQKINISLPSDANVQLNKGSLNIHSSDSVTIASKDINCFSKKVIHRSHEAIVSYDDITANGNELHARYKAIHLISNLINTIAKQAIEKFMGYIRDTEDSDNVKAGQMIRRADGLCSIDSKYTMLNSKKSTKIDGEKILMG